MTRPTLEEHLASAPARVRRSMLDASGSLAPGGAAVVGRFFTLLHERREPIAAPSVETFRLVAASEATFRLLLRTLAQHAPMVSTASALPVKSEWLARRPKAKKSTPRDEDRQSPDFGLADWPPTWRGYHRGLAAAQIAPSSFRRYCASIRRCAELVNSGVAGEELSFFNAYRIAEALRTSRKSDAGNELRPRTVANYIEGLVALGRHGGSDPAALAGVRFLRDHLLDAADAGDKLKYGRIAEIMDKGGFAHVADIVASQRANAADLPDHASEKTKALQTTALCAVAMNKPGRTGDVSRWSLGAELVRHTDGIWELTWEQEKNGRETQAGRLWPEVSEILDELILGGLPDRFVHLRYRELEGANWLTLTDLVRQSKWPSTLVKDAIGIPLHDLRTLAADYLRLHDPASAPDVIATHLGHASREAGASYRAQCEGEAASRSWLELRKVIGSS